MPPWLTIWIARFASGERFRKATSHDYRLWAGFTFFIPVYFGLFMGFGRPFMDRASAVAIWSVLTPVGVVLVFGSFLWARFVPAKVFWTLAVIAWSLMLWYLWHHDL